MATKTISVKGSGDDKKVVLWEKSPLHPKGEIFISNNGKSYEVAETPAVKRLVAEGRLMKASETAPRSQERQPSSQPWEGYDDASVDDVTARLATLDDAGRARVLAYEQGGKARKGVLEAAAKKG